MKTTPSSPVRVYCLEIHLTSHCNITCKGCSQSSPLMDKRLQDIGQLEINLDRLASAVSCSKLQILGGEPLLHPKLLDAMRLCSASSLSQRVVVKTNGLLLHRMPPEFWTNASKVIVSVYPSTKTTLEKRRVALESEAMRFGTEIEFRNWTHFNYISKPGRTASDRITSFVFEKCRFKDFTVSVSGDRLYRCSISVNAVHTSRADERQDSIQISDSVDFQHEVRGFLFRDEPISSCRHCLGSCGAEFQHTTSKIAPRPTPEQLHDYYK